MNDPAAVMDRRHRLVRAFSWLGALAVAATMAMGVGHASVAASQASSTQGVVAHAAHEAVPADTPQAVATRDAVIAAPAGQASALHAGPADCVNCGDHSETVLLTCMLVTVVSMLLAVALPRALPSWSRRIRVIRRAVQSLPRAIPSPVDLTRLGISRT
ncbi:hypothetical protein [Demequina globuliformis]|uniref:hypothetical protein n=1 Tax=Demequina globuliformis TaxID=676202 RepID=UPI00078375B8|nr:hypothetical protein [Demequina globuliformis]